MKNFIITIFIVTLCSCGGGSGDNNGGDSTPVTLSGNNVETTNGADGGIAVALLGSWESIQAVGVPAECPASFTLGSNGQFAYMEGGINVSGTFTATELTGSYSLIFTAATVTGSNGCEFSLVPYMEASSSLVLLVQDESEPAFFRVTDPATALLLSVFEISDVTATLPDVNTQAPTDGVMVGSSGSACLPGTWGVDMEAFRAEVQRTTPAGSTLSNVSGAATLQLQTDGRGTGDIDNILFEYLDQGGIRTELIMNGDGQFSWSADEDTYFTSQSNMSLEIVSTIEIDGNSFEIDLGEIFTAEDFIGDEQGVPYNCNGNVLLLSPPQIEGAIGMRYIRR